MDHEIRSPGVTRLLVIGIPLIALLCVAGLALSADAASKDNETPPNPEQYYDWGHAYNVDIIELGTRIEFRKDGGGDDDYLKLGFLNPNDMVTVTINQSEPTTVVEYWVSDPYHFPIVFYHYLGGAQSPNFTLQFAVIMGGSYFVHTGQGFGDTYINFTFTRQSMTPPSAKDSNNAPNQKILLNDGVTHRENTGNPWDPSDFFYMNIQPTLLLNKYLTIEIETAVGTTVQWELYDSTGIGRPSEIYTSDTMIFGSGRIEDRRITAAGDYIVRIWMLEAYGQYNLTLSVLSYPNDQDNSIDEATLVGDDDSKTGDVNLSFDREDYYEIYLLAGQPLWVRMVPQDGPADLYIFDEFKNQKRASRKAGLAEEFIAGWEPEDDGYYYIVVEALFEAPDYENPPTVSYTLEVWINHEPERVQNPDRNLPVPEDEVDTSYDVSAQFMDADGDDLNYELDMSYNDTLIDIQLLPDNHLRVEPVANASDFSIQILLNATDPRGLMVNLTVTIQVTPVNDGPFVDWAEVPSEITMGEDLVKSGVNVTRAFRDIDDDYSTWTFSSTSTVHIEVELDEQWLATFTPLEDDWHGVETFVVTCTDKGGETATIEFTINMYEINDPPELKRYIPPIDMDEEATFTVDLLDPGLPYFVDPEGKAMTFHFDRNQTVSVSIVGSVVTFTGQKDATGLINTLVLWAEDDLGAVSLNMTVVIELINVGDGPDVDTIIDIATVEEGEGVTFAQDVYYTFVDIDSTAYELGWKWFVNDVEVPPAQITDIYGFEYIPPITDEKDRTVVIRLLVIDSAASAEDDAIWTVTVTNKNVAPDLPKVTAGGFEPGVTPVVKEGKAITFTATGTDLDNDTLTFTWFLDELTEVGTGATLTLKDVKPGPHKVTVEVSDGTSTAETDFEFKVQKTGGSDDSPGFGTLLAALALLGAVGALSLRRRR